MDVDLRAFIIDWKTGKITIDHGRHLLIPESTEQVEPMPTETKDEGDTE
jgi:hypothetical protein